MELESKISGVLRHAEACLAHRDDIDSINSGHLLREYADVLRRSGWHDARENLPPVDTAVIVLSVDYRQDDGWRPKEPAFLRYAEEHVNGSLQSFSPGLYWELPDRRVSECVWVDDFTHWCFIPSDEGL